MIIIVVLRLKAKRQQDSAIIRIPTQPKELELNSGEIMPQLEKQVQ
jgi:hypothetical protein